MKEIELLKIIFKDSPDILNPLNEIDKEIERLNKCYCERTDCSGRIKNSKKYESVQEENERLHSIIKEVREYIEDNKEYTLIEKSSNQDFKGIPTFYYTNEDILNQEMIEKLLEILDKEGDIK